MRSLTMANNKSWEYYQQKYTGTEYPLVWIAGCATPGPLTGVTLMTNTLYLIPFNQMRIATLDKMGIEVTLAAALGKVHLGIYSNNADNDNYPAGRVVNSAELSFATAGLVETGALATDLTADTRYWAALLTNSSMAEINCLPAASMISWGATAGGGVLLPISLNRISGVTYGNLPDPAPTNSGAGDLHQDLTVPAIYLKFSSVT